MDKYALARKTELYITDQSDVLGLDLSQIGVFLPPRLDDFDLNDRISFRWVCKSKWCTGRYTINFIKAKPHNVWSALKKEIDYLLREALEPVSTEG